MMTIKTNWPDAERMCACLGLTITDLMAEAGCDAAGTLVKVREAAAVAAVQQRFLESLADGLAGELLVDDDTDDQRGLRAAVARRGNPPSIASVTPLVRVGGLDPRLVQELEDFEGGAA